MSETLTPEQIKEYQRIHYQALRRQKNVNKHLRIARATTGDESRKHFQEAERLLDRYEALIEKEKINETEK
jgi:hypothetical protein